MPNVRSLLLIALAFTAFLMWQAWQQDYVVAPVATTSDTPSPAATAASADVPDATATTASSTAATPAVDEQPDTNTKAPVVIAETDLLRLQIDTRGATVSLVELLSYPVTPKDKEHPVRLLHDDGEGYFVAQSGLVSATGAAPDHRALFKAEQSIYRLADGAQTLDVPLTWQDASGVQVTKTFRLTRGSYVVEVVHEIQNRSAAAWSGSVYQQLQHSAPTTSSGFSLTNPQQYSFVGAAWYSPEEHFEKLKFEKFADNPLKRQIKGGWAAMLQHHFFAAWIPPAEADYEYTNQVVANTGATRYLIREKSAPQTIAPGADGNFSARLFVGPKLQETLAAVAPGLELTVDYGLVTVISQPLFWVLSKIHSVTGNWGWAIVLITLLLKIVLYPLSEAQFRSMAKMRKLQPRMAALKERYGDDKQKLNQAMMELYTKEKINPMGGCLPVLIQMPVFIALYWVLIESVEMRQAPFMGWITNLSDKDPYFILPILNAAAMIATQRLTPAAGMDPAQQKMMQMMPVVFGVMFAFFPAGLVLYWTVNGVLSLAQQLLITHRVESGSTK